MLEALGAWVIRGDPGAGPLLPARTRVLRMLPDLKSLLCGLLLCIVLFVAAGTITLPESRIHVGEMPEIDRPMMQESITVPPPVPVIAMMVAPRSEAPEAAESGAPGGAETEPGVTSGAAPVDARSPGPETSGAAGSARSRGPAGDPLRGIAGDPLRGIIEGLPGAEPSPPVADAAPDSAAAAAASPPLRDGAARPPGARAPRRARGRRRLPGVVQYHGIIPNGAVAR